VITRVVSPEIVRFDIFNGRDQALEAAGLAGDGPIDPNRGR
jgi:hypothetical protein